MAAIDSYTDPCHCIAMDLDMPLSSSTSGTSPWPQAAGMATHNRLFLSSLMFPVPPPFMRLKLFCFSFPFPSVHHLHMKGLYRWAKQPAGFQETSWHGSKCVSSCLQPAYVAQQQANLWASSPYCTKCCWWWWWWRQQRRAGLWAFWSLVLSAQCGMGIDRSLDVSLLLHCWVL